MNWRPDNALTFGCSRQGASHVDGCTPCQDAWNVRKYKAPNVDALILAAADGHGASIHDLSEFGSKLAVEAMVEELKAFADTFDDESSSQAVRDRFRADVPKNLVDRWRTKVEKDACERLGDKDNWGDDEYPVYFRYGSTALGAMVTPTELFMISIGDGDVINLSANGQVRVHLEQDAPELTGSMTFSLASLDPEMLFETRIIDVEPGGMITLSTDGLAKSFHDPKYFFEFIVATQEQLQAEGLEKTVQPLPNVLDYISEHGSGDDMTYVFAWFRKTTVDKDSMTATHHSIHLKDDEQLEMDGKSVVK